MSKKKIVVVGNGMVGHKFIDNILQSDSDEFDVITFSEEPRLAYDRVQLTAYFKRGNADDLALTSEEYYQSNGVNYLLNAKVAQLDTENKCVVTESGHTESYDTLILATGSFPFVPPIPGNDQEHCHVYRTIEDLDAIELSSKDSKSGVVIGGGLLGLEAANAVKNLGLETHVVEFAPRLMAVQLDDGGGALLRRKIEDLGVQVHTEKATSEIVAGENARYRMNFADGTHLETDMIVFSAGIRPQDALARRSDIAIGERGGIVINDHCQTNIDNVYAIGECALWDNKIFGLVAPGYSMAKIAAAHILSDGTSDASFTGADMSTKLKLLGVDVASIGEVHGQTEGAQSYTYNDEIEQVYKRLIISADGKKIVGAVLVGDAEAYGSLLQIKQNDMPLPENPSVLILPNVADDSGSAMGVEALPDSAVICSCFDVTKGDIKDAVSAGCTTMAALKETTNASTGCGGCSALAKQVLDSELSNLGVEVSNDICEHFAYSRQELTDIIRVNKIKTFDEMLDSHGNGLGCTVCKPAVGSILASYWNDYILEDQHIELQDTNDIYLGNMQKDGTYSVVPRIAGGEITPDKLIVLGEVAKEFDLYTKITGGQRVDLFGAQLNELPIIWKKLIDAGFETGHAYGKSVRTVKSCVGSTWCRYGVDDSVGLAIRLENRYKGLRSPHKIKFAVSGCTRECAEAQSKDIGVIATDKGWNLYICGNGGMRPRHADLFATDLDETTLLKYIDRVLMFYTRTADRLQRTSVWMENLEGGIEYLKQVVIEDKLNVAEELEADIALNIEKYQCEWKTTIESPEKMKRFQHYINSEEMDTSLSFIKEREQRFPKPSLSDASNSKRDEKLAKADQIEVTEVS
ncbi:nitrite reductase large subunit NirB [Vibrio crassostreae]|uniref:nitrite reductase large subunit NirB n=1 Tax=Vibrio crassostreae TaxID=246167 RepID=UPI000F4674D6|nr:nitrite reductase large subunit NirB [Vibrio crassostreae]ROQ75294.1 assimilatory nitrite reductase (NAD(P)H) large subunit precursor [Vibrio crassostreae]ROR79668.1 assimilatory nitrite reductase (NAD(P)H) large subunit precursor [Vibrio crassostreae]TQL40125.1 assimilatory nitrite reductase (NAD(P)H) large subunit precursor [Vibrio crassostreae]